VAKGLHGGVWRHAHTLFNDGVIGDVADEQLLERFVTAHREAGEMAFEVLVERHGPMVLRICRTILRDEHDAEDAFQATFFVLARQAASIRSRASLASWLYGVARRVASSARSAASRRREHEQKAADLAARSVVEPSWDDLAQVLHEEIDRLPECYRAPIVLCDLEGLTEGQAARQLDRPVGTIRSRLARGRQRLSCQLLRRGLAPESIVLVGACDGRSSKALVASALVDATVRSAMQFAVVRVTTAGMVASSAAALAEEVLGSMLMVRIKNTAMAALVAIGITTVGAFALDSQGEKSRPASDAKREILGLMHAWAKAVVQSDVGTMDRLLAYELIGTDPTGCLWDKAKYLEHVRTNAFHVESIAFKDTRIDVYGDAAVETGLGRSEINSNRPPYVVERGYIEERVTRTWNRRHGSWQCVAFQTMVIAAGEHESDAQRSDSKPDRDSVPKGGQDPSPTLPHPALRQ
jgi:RNA polymerase sigma factor (sigma-70 family)